MHMSPSCLFVGKCHQRVYMYARVFCLSDYRPMLSVCLFVGKVDGATQPDMA